MPTHAPHLAFHIAVVLLHTCGGIVALVTGLACRVGPARQIPIVPRAVPALPGDPLNISMWAHDVPVPLLALNPYLFIMAFEWITAAFAWAYLRRTWPVAVPVAQLVWLATGTVLTVVWICLTLDYPCPLQGAVLLLLYAYSMWLCLHPYQRLPHRRPHAHQTHRSDGREWVVPSSVVHLKRHEPEHEDTAAEDEEIMFRYDEYAITAPLLFLAVVALFLPGPPVWLELSCYFLIAACNVWGAPLHVAYVAHWRRPEAPAGSWLVRNARALVCIGPWRSRATQRFAALWMAWLSLLAPLVGLLYLTRQFWFSSGMPWIAVVMSWNLLLTFCLFGLIPTAVYATGRWRAWLPWLLDLLNLLAKVPLPWLILAAFQTRPAGFRPCG